MIETAVERKKRLQREASRRFYQNNKEKCAESTKIWREKNPNYGTKWAKNNPEKVKEYQSRTNAKPETKARLAKWREQNPEKVELSRKLSDEKNPSRDRVRAMRARRMAEDPIKARADAAKRVADWRSKNIEKHRAVQKNWRDANREILIGYAVARKKNLRSIGRLSKGLNEILLSEQGWKCPYCPASFHDVRYSQDHYTPIKKGGAHEDSNMQLVCKPCNSKKKDKDPIEFLEQIFKMR